MSGVLTNRSRWRPVAVAPPLPHHQGGGEDAGSAAWRTLLDLLRGNIPSFIHIVLDGLHGCVHAARYPCRKPEPWRTRRSWLRGLCPRPWPSAGSGGFRPVRAESRPSDAHRRLFGAIGARPAAGVTSETIGDSHGRLLPYTRCLDYPELLRRIRRGPLPVMGECRARRWSSSPTILAPPAAEGSAPLLIDKSVATRPRLAGSSRDQARARKDGKRSTPARRRTRSKSGLDCRLGSQSPCGPRWPSSASLNGDRSSRTLASPWTQNLPSSLLAGSRNNRQRFVAILAIDASFLRSTRTLDRPPFADSRADSPARPLDISWHASRLGSSLRALELANGERR